MLFATVLATSLQDVSDFFGRFFVASPSFTGMVFPLQEPCFGLPCLLYFSVFFAAVLATSLLAHLEKLQRIRLRLFRRFFVASPSFTGNVLPCPGALFCATVSAFQRVLGKRAGNVVSSCFGKVSDETLGLLSVLLCGFSVLHWHGVSLSGSHALGCRVCFPCFLQTCWQRRF